MQLGDFKALYDDPATRPIILDTRTEQTFASGHIPGAILFPSDQVAANVGTLPKDKLIVAYCQ
jgi:rhodanese-related sulfurtransferase